MAVSVYDLLNSDNYRPYFVPVARHLKSIHAAIFLSELITREKYHREKGHEFLEFDGKKWFYYTLEKANEQLAMSRKEQDTAVKILIKHNLIRKIQKQVPAKRFFHINIEEVENLVYFSKKDSRLSETDKLECPKGANSSYYTIKRSNKKKERETDCPEPASGEFSFDGQAAELFSFLLSKIKENNPKAKDLTDRGRIEAIKEIERLRRLDKYSYDEIKEMIEFSQKHEFWKCNVLSAGKLRKHAPKLILQMKNGKEKPAEPERVREREEKQNNRNFAHQLQNNDDFAEKAVGSKIRLILYCTEQYAEVSVSVDEKKKIPYTDADFKKTLVSMIKSSIDRQVPAQMMQHLDKIKKNLAKKFSKEE